MKKRFLLLILLLVTITGYSQDKDGNSIEKIAKNGLKIYLDKDSSAYFKFGIAMQFWYRYAELNDGTIDAKTGNSLVSYSDFAMRRMRLSSSFVFDRHMIYTQFGLTNEAQYNNLSRGVFFNDFWYKYRYANKHFVGAGKHMWNGLSRISTTSSMGQITVDIPGFNFPNVNVDNDFVRQIGVFFNGQIGRFDYHFSINQPQLPLVSSKIFNDQEIIEKSKVNVAFSRYHNRLNSKGYISYSFLDQEKVAQVPFKKMTYYGKKGNYLNVGLGYHYNPEASGFMNESNRIMYKDQIALAVDLWYEVALSNESALNIYSALYYYDYGPNYIRPLGVMNGFNFSSGADTPPQGPGISHYYFGTGNVAYLLASYVIPRSIIDSDTKLVPFAAISYKSLDALSENSTSIDAGFNYHILGNNVKIGAQYSTRPIYEGVNWTIEDYKGLFIVQLQARF